MVRGNLEFARHLRHDSTDAERRLWFQLRAHRFEGLKFRRQHPVGPYIVDFCCSDLRLIVEIDGGQHAERSIEDQQRTRSLEASGYRVVRYWNNEVLGNLEGVLTGLREVVARLAAPLPSPPPASGGRE